jgi:hypothetical protein
VSGQRKALIIANDEYEQEAMRGLIAAADAEALGRVLGDPQIGDFAVQVVRNASAHVIQAHVEELFSESQPDDVLLLYISGHTLKSRWGEMFFAASNTHPDRLPATAVSADFVQQCVQDSRSRGVVLLLDCFYGGAFAEGVKVRAAGDVNVLDSFLQGRSGGGRGRAVITASSAMEYAFEGDQQRRPSVFTSALVEGLATGAADRDKDGLVSLNELYDYVFDKVRGQNPYQTPSRRVELDGELYLARSRRDVNVSASDGGVAAGVIHGNVAPLDPVGPDSEESGVVEETAEAEAAESYYSDGYGGRTRESAVREAGRLAEAEARRQAAQALARARRERAEAAEPPSITSVQPPAQPVVYDDLVRKAFADLVKLGRLLFNPPDHMQLGQTVRVEVRLTRTLELAAELLQHLRGPGEPQLEEIPTAPLMAVTLKGDGFRIETYSDEEQSVTQGEITTWEFDIRALKRGSQRLVMCVSLRIPVLGQPLEHKSIPVREAMIDVQVGVSALVAHFVSSNWQWFIGTAIAIAAVLVAVLYH